MALSFPFTQIVRLMVLVSFHKDMHRRVRLIVLVSFHKEMHTQPCGTELPFSKIVGLMVLVSFHKEMHTQPCGTELSFLSEGYAL